MFNVTGGEVIIIVLVALVVLGPDRIPEVARNIGRLINKAKTMSEGFQSTVSDISDDPSMKPLKDLGELAARPRQKLAEFAAEAEAEERAQRKLEEKTRMEAEQAEAALASPTDDVDNDIGPPPERPVAPDPTSDDSTSNKVALEAVPGADAEVALEAVSDSETELRKQ